MLHDRAEGSELLLVLTDLAAVGGIGLLDAVEQLADLLTLAVQLDVEAVVVRRKLGILTLQLNQFIGQVLLVDSQVIDHLLSVYPDISKHGCQDDGHDCQNYDCNFQSLVSIVRLVVLRVPFRCGTDAHGSFVLFHFQLICF